MSTNYARRRPRWDQLADNFPSMFFPPETESGREVPSSGETGANDKEDAEAKAVADELPSAPTGELSDTAHVGKKQKQGDA